MREPKITMQTANSTRRFILVSSVLALFTVALFWPAVKGNFLNYDDDVMVSENPCINGFSARNLSWAFHHTTTGIWMPMTWVSYMLDNSLFGKTAAGYHVTNIALHTANTLLLLFLLFKMTGRIGPSAFVAALFAMHPLRVESVAWIAERKDVLSVFFCLLGLMAYVRHVRNPKPTNFMIVVMLMMLSLMSKPMFITFPFLLLLLDYWPLNRARGSGVWLRLALEKIPLFFLTLVFCLIAILAQKSASAIPHGSSSIAGHAARVIGNYFFYIRKIIWPQDLAVIYPQAPPALAAVTAAALLLVLVTWWVLRQGAAKPCLAVGWFWFLGALVPVIGIIPIGHVWTADRYTYFPSIGLFLMLVWGIYEMAAGRKRLYIVSIICAGCLLAAYAYGTRLYLRCWANSATLFERARAVNPNDPLVYDVLGLVVEGQGRQQEALSCFRKALNLDANDVYANVNIGRMLLQLDRYQESLPYIEKAIKIAPNNEHVLNNMGIGLACAGRYQESISYFEKALQLDPYLLKAHLNMGLALMKVGRDQEAIEHLAAVLGETPQNDSAQFYLGLLLQKNGQMEAALAHLNKSAELKPDNVQYLSALAVALYGSGRKREAVQCYDRAVRMAPAFIETLNNLAWILAVDRDNEVRNPVRALALALKAAELSNSNDASVLDTLAAAYAANGQFAEALATAEQSMAVAKRQGMPGWPMKIGRRMETYRDHKPWVE